MSERSKAKDPNSRLNRAHYRSRSRELSALKTGDAATNKTPYGFVKHSKSRWKDIGGSVTSRLEDYNGASVGDCYKDFKPAYTTPSSDKGRNSLAKLYQIAFAKGGAEERRNPGSSKLARAADRLVKNGKYTYDDMFGNQEKSHFLPARTGGAKMMREEFSTGEYSEKHREIAAYMSDSSDDEVNVPRRSQRIMENNSAKRGAVGGKKNPR